MRITQWGEYGVHCSVYIALRHSEGFTTVNAAEIAEAQGIALLYTQQILQRLRRNKLIESVRGPQGGYKLTRPPSEITLYDILVASEGDTFSVICDSKPINAERCAEGKPCALRAIWYDFKDHVNSYLTGITLEALLDRTQQAEPDQLIQMGNRQD